MFSLFLILGALCWRLYKDGTFQVLLLERTLLLIKYSHCTFFKINFVSKSYWQLFDLKFEPLFFFLIWQKLEEALKISESLITPSANVSVREQHFKANRKKFLTLLWAKALRARADAVHVMRESTRVHTRNMT